MRLLDVQREFYVLARAAQDLLDAMQRTSDAITRVVDVVDVGYEELDDLTTHFGQLHTDQ